MKGKPKVVYKKKRQTKVKRKNYSLDNDKHRTALAPGKRISANGNVYYEYRQDRTDLKGIDLPIRKTKVKKHTRNDGSVDVRKHDRELQTKKASEGSNKPTLSLQQQIDKREESISKGQRSELFQDIGDKFGGAKKDLWADRRQLEWDDILELEKNTADALQFITKSKVIQPIDEQSELASGTTAGTIYLKRLAYKYLSNKPKINSKEARAFYFKEATSVFQSISNIKTVDQFVDFQREYNRGLWTRGIRKDYFKDRLGGNFYAILTRTTQGSAEKVSIAKEIDRNNQGLDKVDELMEVKKKGGEKGKTTTYKKPYLLNVERIGGKTIGTANPELIIKELGLRGVEYGNWVNDKEAQKNVKYFIGSMYDLKDITGIDVIEINKAGKLGIAFGSRGSGSALAHFEPYRNVINLTKKNGDGSLAHEWGHYFDHILKAKFGDKNVNNGDSATFLTNDFKNPKNRVQQAMAEVMKVMTEGNAVDEVEYEKPKGYKPSYSFERDYNNAKSRGLSDSQIFQTYVEKAQNRRDIDIESTKKLKSIYNLSEKDIEKRTKSAERKYTKSINEVGRLIAYLKPEGKVKLGLQTGKSEYYTRSNKQGSGNKNGYWTAPHEMFARAFESFIQDKLELSGRKNNYLANGTGSLRMSNEVANKNNFPYPAGEERKKINNAIEKFLGVFNSGKGSQPIQNINHPSQQDSFGRSYTKSFELRGTHGVPVNLKYSLYEKDNGWAYSVFDTIKDKMLGSGWALNKEQAELNISKLFKGVY